MIYCINPLCESRKNPNEEEKCLSCGTPLLINGRIQLIKPLREFDPFAYNEIFEVLDTGTEWDPGSKIRIMKIMKWRKPKYVKLFERESEILQLINHPRIPKSTIDDVFRFTPNGTSLVLRCFVMDKFEGIDLYQWTKSNGKLSEKLAMEWLEQLVKILDEVHHSEFFHRDIKPSNIICQPNGKLALIDFGAARNISETYMAKISASGGTSTDTSRYEVTSILSPYYTPNEQMNGKAVPQSDFYALGRTFIYLLTNIPLNKLPTDKKTGKLIWRNKAPHIDKSLANLIDDLQADLPGQRPQNTEIILQRLNRLPFQSRINRIAKSKSFRIGAFVLSFLAILVAYNGLKPIVANYFFNQGKKAETENRFTEAKKNFNLAVYFNQNIKKSISNFYSQKAFNNSSRPSIAKKYYQLAIKFNTNNITVYNNLALVCQQLLDFQCVNDSYSHALKLNSNDWIIHYNLGSFYDHQEKYNKATQQYHLAIKKSNNTAIGPINNLSRLNNKNGNYQKAESLVRQALKMHKLEAPDKNIQAPLYKNLGWSLLGQKSYQKAHDYLQQASELDPQRADTYCLLAQAQEKLNLTSDAKLSWELCLILNSSLPEVRTWRIKVIHRFL